MDHALGQLGIDWKLLILQTVNFLLVLYLLKRFAFDKMLEFMDARKQRIEEGLQMREKAEHDIEQGKELRRLEIEKARQEAEEIITQAREAATKQEDDILLKARQEAERIVKRAEEDIQHQTEATIREARDEIVTMAMQASEKVLRRSMTAEDQRRMAEEVLSSIQSNHNAGE